MRHPPASRTIYLRVEFKASRTMATYYDYPGAGLSESLDPKVQRTRLRGRTTYSLSTDRCPSAAGRPRRSSLLTPCGTPSTSLTRWPRHDLFPRQRSGNPSAGCRPNATLSPSSRRRHSAVTMWLSRPLQLTAGCRLRHSVPALGFCASGLIPNGHCARSCAPIHGLSASRFAYLLEALAPSDSDSAVAVPEWDELRRSRSWTTLGRETRRGARQPRLPAQAWYDGVMARTTTRSAYPSTGLRNLRIGEPLPHCHEHRGDVGAARPARQPITRSFSPVIRQPRYQAGGASPTRSRGDRSWPADQPSQPSAAD